MRGFRMPLYPLPVLLALGASSYSISRPNFLREMAAGFILIAGSHIYGLATLRWQRPSPISEPVAS